MTPRITMIGGGSYHWTPRLLVDFANTPSLENAEVVLHDLDAERLARMTALGASIADRAGVGLRVWSESDRRASLDGADYVVTAFSVGGFDSMQHDLEIPERFGIRQPIGDSVGPGGVMRALRSIPVLLDFAHDIEQICPDAWLVNVTNPLTALVRAATRETRVKTVGLCNEWVGCQFVLSLLLDCGMRDLDPVIGGVNHFPIVTELRAAGEDGFVMLRALLDDPARAETEGLWMDPSEVMEYEKVVPGERWTKADVLANNRVRFEVFDRFGVLTASGDHHATEFFPGFVHPANDYGRDWKVHLYGLKRHMADAEADVEHYEVLRDAAEIPRRPSGELVATLLDGLVSGEPRHLPVNLPNAGNVNNLADGCVVEMMGIADASGVRGRDNTTVPGALGEFVRRVNASQELTVEAALTGNRTRVLEAMLTDPLAGQLPYESVVEMADEMLTATSRWLPQFN